MRQMSPLYNRPKGVVKPCRIDKGTGRSAAPLAMQTQRLVPQLWPQQPNRTGPNKASSARTKIKKPKRNATKTDAIHLKNLSPQCKDQSPMTSWCYMASTYTKRKEERTGLKSYYLMYINWLDAISTIQHCWASHIFVTTGAVPRTCTPL